MRIKSNKSKGIVAKSQKDVFISKLKILTKALVSDVDQRKLDFLTRDKDDNRKLKFRLYSYFLNNPRMIRYLNNHLNGLYDFEQYEISDIIYTFKTLTKLFNINSTNDLYYTKFRTDEYSNFYNTIVKYYKEKNLDKPSNSEIQGLYTLYCNNIITENEIEKMNDIISGKQKKSTEEKKLDTIVNVNKPNLKQTELSENIKTFNESVEKYIRRRPICKNCPMYSKGSVILDTNLPEPGPVDIAFIGLNPGKDEFQNKKPFVGKSGQLLRDFLQKYVEKFNISYAIYNTILCWSNNAKEIPNINAVTKNCWELVQQIDQLFPAKIRVLIGADAVKARLGNIGGITKINGTIQDGYFIMIHPSAILRSPNRMKDFEHAWKELHTVLQNEIKLDNTSKSNSTENQIFQINEDKIIKNFDNEHTLFDIQMINEKVIYIFIDKNGDKKYLYGEQIQFPIYLKSGNYQANRFVEDMSRIEAVSYLTKEEKENLNKKLYYNLKNIIR